MASVLGNLAVDWPKSVMTVFEGPIALLDFEVDIITLNCVREWNFVQNFGLQLERPPLNVRHHSTLLCLFFRVSPFDVSHHTMLCPCLSDAAETRPGAFFNCKPFFFCHINT